MFLFNFWSLYWFWKGKFISGTRKPGREEILREFDDRWGGSEGEENLGSLWRRFEISINPPPQSFCRIKNIYFYLIFLEITFDRHGVFLESLDFCSIVILKMPPKKNAKPSAGDAEGKKEKAGTGTSVKVRHILCEKQSKVGKKILINSKSRQVFFFSIWNFSQRCIWERKKTYDLHF